jgi:hypothetical protein
MAGAVRTNPTTEVDVLVATHGWWPWLLTLLVLVLVVGGAGYYFVRRRGAKA